MKKEKTKKRLSLNKETVAHLGRDEMNEALGGCTVTELLSFLTLCNNPSEDTCVGKIPTTKCTR